MLKVLLSLVAKGVRKITISQIQKEWFQIDINQETCFDSDIIDGLICKNLVDCDNGIYFVNNSKVKSALNNYKCVSVLG